MSARQGATGYALGVALCGGGFRGMAHIGVLRELGRRGLRSDFIAGASACRLVGALYASGRNTEEIEALAGTIFWPKLLGSNGLADFCRDHLPRTCAELPIALSVVVSALPSRKPVVFDSRNLEEAIAASCAMPPSPCTKVRSRGSVSSMTLWRERNSPK